MYEFENYQHVNKVKELVNSHKKRHLNKLKSKLERSDQTIINLTVFWCENLYNI